MDLQHAEWDVLINKWFSDFLQEIFTHKLESIVILNRQEATAYFAVNLIRSIVHFETEWHTSSSIYTGAVSSTFLYRLKFWRFNQWFVCILAG